MPARGDICFIKIELRRELRSSYHCPLVVRRGVAWARSGVYEQLLGRDHFLESKNEISAKYYCISFSAPRTCCNLVIAIKSIHYTDEL